MRRSLFAVIASCFGAVLLPAQPNAQLCPTVIGIYPVDFKFYEPLRQRARFEIRSCADGRGTIQLLGFKANTKTPSLLGEGTDIGLLIQTGTLIVVQTTAGSSSPTLVAQFQNGKPVLLSREHGTGGVKYAEEHKDGDDYAIITIPQKTFPDEHGKFPDVPLHRYRLKIHE